MGEWTESAFDEGESGMKREKGGRKERRGAKGVSRKAPKKSPMKRMRKQKAKPRRECLSV